MSDVNREVAVAVKLSREVEQAVREMQRVLVDEAELVYKFGERTIPHLTIYTVEYPGQNEQRVVEEMQGLAGELAPFTLELDRVEVNPEYVEVMVKNSSKMQNLHYRVMERLNPLREGRVRENFRDPKFLSDYPAGEHENIKQWGRPLVGKYYRPHISVGRRADKGRFEKRLVSWQARTMRVEKLLVGRSGSFGVLREVWEEVKLVG